MRSDPSVQALLDRFHVTVEDIPVVICRGETLAKNPSNEWLAECLGMNPQLADLKQLCVLMMNSAASDGGVFHLWGHSWEVEEMGLWRQLEEVLETASAMQFEARTNSQLA